MKRTKSGLLIPVKPNEEPKFVCNVPSCDWHGWTEPERVRHAITHANDEDLMHELTRSPADEIMGEGDPEMMAYLRRKHRQLQGTVPDPLNPKRY